jgi:phosphoglycolate phosphatase
MFSAVIFDMDGVLIDSHPLHVRNWCQIAAEAGREVNERDLDVLFEGARRAEILRYILGEVTEREIDYFCRRKEQLFKEGEGELRMIAGVGEFLGLLEEARVPKAVVTSGSKSRSERLLKRFQLTHHFSTVITGDSVLIGKHDPAIFRLAFDHLGVRAEQCLLFEDSSIAIRSASILGMHAVGIAPASRASKMFTAGAVVVAPDFKSLQFGQLCARLGTGEVSNTRK